MKKWTFIFLFVLNISGACALFPVSSSSVVATEQPQPRKVIKISDIAKGEIQRKFPWISDRIYSIVEKESAKYKEVSPMLVASIMWKESRGNILAESHVGAKGIMQVMPVHYKGNPNDLFNTELNIKLGVKELASCYKKKNFRSDIWVLKCYNAGPSHVPSEYKNWEYIEEITNNYDDLSNKVMDKVMVYIDSGYEVI